MISLKLRINIVKDPKAFISYLMLSCEENNIDIFKRSTFIRKDVLGPIPFSILEWCARKITSFNVLDEIYKTQIFFNPKAALFCHKSPHMMESHTNNFFMPVDRRVIENKKKIQEIFIDSHLKARTPSANTTVIILAKDSRSVKDIVIKSIKRPLICCFGGENAGNNLVSGEGNLQIFEGEENPFERIHSALQFIETDYVFIIGDDDYVFDGFLGLGERVLGRLPEVAAVCGIGTDASLSSEVVRPGSPLKQSIRYIRMTENPIQLRDLKMRATEWALFGGLSMNCHLRKKDLEKILRCRPPAHFIGAFEYYFDICLLFLGSSVRINEASIVRSRSPDSGTYLNKPPILETASDDGNILREITKHVIAFAKDNEMDIDNDLIEWVVAYGSARRFIENRAFNKGISTLPKTLSKYLGSTKFPNSFRREIALLHAFSIHIFEDRILENDTM